MGSTYYYYYGYYIYFNQHGIIFECKFCVLIETCYLKYFFIQRILTKIEISHQKRLLRIMSDIGIHNPDVF